MSVLSLFRLVVMLAFTAWVCFPLLAEGETPMSPMPILPEDYLEDDDTGGEEEDSTTTNMVSSITFSYH